jgi:DNA-binding NarL/FixJ family response regulator
MSELHQLVLDGASRGAVLHRPRTALSTARSAWDSAVGAATLEPIATGGATRVYVYAKDGILRAGVASQLRRCPEVALKAEYGFDPDGVSLIAADEVTEELIGAIRAVRRSCTPKVIVITNRLSRDGAQAALEAGAWAFVRRCDARPDRLVSAVLSVAVAVQPPASVDEALGELTAQLEPAPAPPPSRPAGLSDRDVEVLRLMANGHSTAGIARDLSYSESTIKNIIHAIVHELGARNRTHAVAMALRTQLI